MKHKLYCWLLAACLCAGYSGLIYAEESAVPKVIPPIPVPSQIVPGQIIDLPVAGITVENAKTTRIHIYPKDESFFKPVADWQGKLSILFIPKAPGKYWLLISCGNDSKGVDELETEINVSGTPKPPDPPKPPEPPEPPTPTPTKITVVVVEETSQSTQAFAQIRSSKKIRDWAKAGGNTVFFLDKDAVDSSGNTPTDFKPWLILASKKSLPWVFIIDKTTNERITDMAVPATEDAFLTLLQRYGITAPQPPYPSIPRITTSPYQTCPGGQCGK